MCPGTADGYYRAALAIPVKGRPIDWGIIPMILLADLLRSDHQTFWGYDGGNRTQGLPAVWLTDTGRASGRFISVRKLFVLIFLS